MAETSLRVPADRKIPRLAESASLAHLLRPVLRGSGNGQHLEERVVHSRQ